MRIVRLGAHCELVRESFLELHFSISEFAVLEDGREITLHDERGFGGRFHGPPDVGAWDVETRESIERNVLNVVLPDDAEETGEPHPWTWLQELALAKGVIATEEELRAVPYEVRLGESVTSRLKERL